MSLVNASPEVTALIQSLDPPRRQIVEMAREIILRSHPSVQEGVKWKAPSYGIGEGDRVTFRLAPKGSVQLIFHRGAMPADSTDFSFSDPTGLLRWAARDRAVLELGSVDEVKEMAATLEGLVQRWFEATRLSRPAVG